MGYCVGCGALRGRVRSFPPQSMTPISPTFPIARAHAPRLARRLGFLAVLTAAIPLLSLADGSADMELYRARTALRDGVFEQAERLAMGVFTGEDSSEVNRSSALELVFEARMASKGPAEVLAELDAGTLGDAVHLPANGEVALWRANALLKLNRGQEAAEVLDKALPDAAAGLKFRMQKLIPEALLSAGSTNDALSAYGRLADELIQNDSPDAHAMRLKQARLLRSLDRPREAVGLLDPSARMPPDLQAASRMLRAELLLDLGESGDAEPLLREAAADRRESNRAYRAPALLRLARMEGADNSTNGLSSALAAAEAAAEFRRKGDPDPRQEYAAWALAAELAARGGDALRSDMDDCLRKAAQILPDDAAELDGLRLRCAAALLSAEDAEGALSLYDALAASASSPVFESQALLGRGRCLEAQQLPDTAAIAFTRAAELAEPERRGEAYYCAAEAFRRARAPEKAADSFAKAADPAAGLDETRRTYAQYFAAESIAAVRPEDGAAALRTLAEESSGTPIAARALLGVARLTSGDDLPAAMDRAVVAARAALDTNLLCAALIESGRESARRFEFESAERAFAEAAGLSVEQAPEAAYLRVLALYNLGREEAAADACQGVRTNRDFGVWSALATLWLGKFEYNNANASNGRFANAARLFDEFAETWPDLPEVPDAMLLAARALFADKQLEEAADHAARFVERFPDSPDIPAARRIQGESLQEQMRFDEAILVYDDILRAWPGSPDARAAQMRKGACLFALGTGSPSRYEEAAECFRQLLTEAEAAEAFTVRYRLGRCLERCGKPEEAFNSYYDNVLAFDAAAEAAAKAGKSGSLLLSREEVLEMYSRSILNAAELAETKNIKGGRATAMPLLRRLAESDLPGSAKAKETLDRLKDTPPTPDHAP